jgi:hypothetical protein
VLLFWHALGSARELAATGWFGDRFHVPFIQESLIPPRSVWVVLVALRLLFAAMATVGQGARVGLFGSAVLGIYTILCDRLEYHHNRYALFLFAMILSFAPSDRSFSIIGQPDDSRHGPLWAQRLAQTQVSIIYLASGIAKLIDSDWRAGVVLSERLAKGAWMAVEHGVPQRWMDFLAQATVSSALAKGTIATELFLSIALWIPRTRVFALWLGVWFHLLIQITSQVETFTLLMWLALALFTTPDVHARKLFYDPSRPLGGIYARLVGGLDWLARFEIKPWEPDDIKGHHLVVVRRDGSRATGIRALAMVARCTPLLFPLWPPIALAASFTRGGDTSTRPDS